MADLVGTEAVPRLQDCRWPEYKNQGWEPLYLERPDIEEPVGTSRMMTSQGSLAFVLK